MLLGYGHTLHDRGLRHNFTRSHEVLHLTEYPRAAIRRPADHHTVHAVSVEHLLGLGARIDVTVADDGNLHVGMVFHLAYKRPVGLAAIHLRTRAPMYGNGGDTHILQTEGYLDDILRILVPPQTRLHRDGCVDGLDDAARHLHHRRHVAHHARAGAATRNLTHRAAEVYVDKVGRGALGDTRRLDHRFDKMSVYLYSHGTFGIIYAQLGARLPRVAYQPVTRDELRGNDVGTEALAHVSERRVGHILHRCQKQRLRPQINVSYFHP